METTTANRARMIAIAQDILLLILLFLYCCSISFQASFFPFNTLIVTSEINEIKINIPPATAEP